MVIHLAHFELFMTIKEHHFQSITNYVKRNLPTKGFNWGIWLGDYPDCQQTIQIYQLEHIVVGIKLTGGINFVPAGEITWYVNLADNLLTHGTIAEEDFRNPRFIDATITIIDSETIKVDWLFDKGHVIYKLDTPPTISCRRTN